MMRLIIRAFALAALANALSAQSLSAQASRDSLTTRRFCLNMEPLPACTWFPVTDAAFILPLVTTRVRENPTPSPDADFLRAFRWAFGAMRNTGPTRAVGFSGAVAVDSDGKISPAIEGRRRYWLREASGFVDVTGGYVAKTVSVVWDEMRPRRLAQGVTAAVAYSPGIPHIISLVTRGDLVFLAGERRPRGAISVGAQTSDWRAVAVSLVAASLLSAGNILVSEGFR